GPGPVGLRAAPGAGADRTAADHRAVPGGAAPVGGAAARVRRRAAGHGAAGAGEVGAEPVPGHVPHLPAHLRRAGRAADPDDLDLPGLSVGAAGRLVLLGGIGVPLPARGHAPARRLRAVRTAAPARSFRPGAARRTRAAYRR